MNRKLLPLILFIFIIAPNLLHSQGIEKISKDTGKFIKELTRMKETIDDRSTRKDAEEFNRQFGAMWDSDTLSKSQKKNIIGLINKMLERRHKIHPDIYTFLKTTLAFIRTKNFDKSFSGYVDGLSYKFKRMPKNRVMKIIRNLKNFFTKGNLTSYTSSTWQATSKDYSITYNKKNRAIQIKIPKTDLIAYAYEDSSIIYNTSGYFKVGRERWHGEGGKVTWENAGLDPEMVYAKLGKYEIKMQFTKYIIRDVNFYHNKYFDEPLLGRLSNQVQAGSSSNNKKGGNYPRFNSSGNQQVIKNIFPDFDYRGGFSMRGNKVVASGSGDGMATITAKKNNKPFIKMKAKDFAIDTNRIVSRQASVKILIEEDSIYHPAVRVTYENDRKLLSLYRDKKGLSHSPFYDSYHQVDIDVESMFWKIGEEKIRLKNLPSASGKNTAFFRSMDYFDEKEFEKIKGINRTNPLYRVKRFYDATGKRYFHIDKINKFIDYAPHAVKRMMLKLTNMGFLNYNLDNDMITIRERLFNYLKARAGKIDYDVIHFASRTTNQSNAELSLLDHNLKLFGVKMIRLSDSQEVFIKPKNDQLVLKKNRDFEFDGRIKAGRFVIHGNDFEFSYDKFKIDMELIDSLEFWIRPFKEDREKMRSKKKYVESVIQGMKGELLIDDPNNKSGLKPFTRYPVLNSETKSYVYYDKNCVHKNIYKRDNFYYRLDPFSIDSLDNFTTEGLEFTGYLASSGIFPVIEEPLSVQKDYSLGFVTQTPSTGYNAYGGKGHYKNTIMLSNQGLQGNGTLKYLTAKAKSREFNFFPDSTNAMAYEYSVESQKGSVEYPNVNGEQVYIHWEPYNDLMYARNTEKPFKMYDKEAELEGDIKYTPEAMIGDGLMHIVDADINSERFEYDRKIINADTSDFMLNTQKSEYGLGAGDKVERDLITYNYQTKIDFSKRKGEFISNEGTSQVKFPVNQYVSYIDRFTWFMDKEELEFSTDVSEKLAQKYDNMDMKALADIDLKGARFISTHPSQDSLEFHAENAIYNRNNHTIKARGVQMIRVADAAVYPGDKRVTILRRAEMKELTGAKILANTTTKYHTIKKATINIDGRYEYHARGNYNYVDKNGEIQTIYFNNIYVDSTTMTNGKGKIKEVAGFKLSPAFKYKGNVKLVSTEEHLKFDGGFQIRNPCDTLPKHWVKFTSTIDPENVRIPIDSNIKTMGGGNAYASILYVNNNKNVYSSFFSEDKTQRLREGNEIFSSTGYLVFNDIASEYRIASKEKLKQQMLPGNYTAYNTRDCIHNGEGKINFYEETGQLNLNTYGKIEHYKHEDSTQINAVMSIDFFFNDDARELMAKRLKSYKSLEGANLNNDRFKKALYQMTNKSKADELISNLTVYNELKDMPEELKKTMLLTDVSLKWHEQAEAFISNGPIGIGFIGEKQITRYVDGTILLNKGRRGGGFSKKEIYILLEISTAEWYFFNYEPKTGTMTVTGASDEFKEILSNLKDKDREMDTSSDEPSFKFSLGSERQKESFTRKLKRIKGER